MKMKKIEIYDPSACCVNKVDPVLDQVAEDLRWVATQGIEVGRYSLACDPHAFTANADVLREMGIVMDRLPITGIDGNIVAVGGYLSRAQLAQKFGLNLDCGDKTDPKAQSCCQPRRRCC